MQLLTILRIVKYPFSKYVSETDASEFCNFIKISFCIFAQTVSLTHCPYIVCTLIHFSVAYCESPACVWETEVLISIPVIINYFFVWIIFLPSYS